MKRLAFLALALAACAGPANVDHEGPSFSGPPLATVTSDSGQFTIDVRSDPQPPSRGVNAFELTVKDSSGNPVNGLTVEAVPWMPEMGHGSSVTPAVSVDGDGSYAITNVSCPMPGNWQLRITFNGELPDHATVSFQIP